jgi:hypothetical protein
MADCGDVGKSFGLADYLVFCPRNFAGTSAVRLVAVAQAAHKVDRRAILEKFMRDTKGKVTPGPCAARSADFLYDEAGLPA